MKIQVQTPRLTLIPLTHNQLRIWKQFGREELAKSLEIKHNPWEMGLFYEQEMLQALSDFWIPQTAKFPLDYYWYTNWEIILKDASCSVGGIGLAGLPDNDGTTEIGYAIDQKFEGQGIASEAVEALSKWVFEDKDMQILRAETPIENIASQRVLMKNNFQKTGEKTLELEIPMEVFTWERHR
ncbi:GNAT family N-acetyltransferase [Aquirufa echingensis]|uniref:GNAT family N-acetyltransferase n=1 Tax=Aquirufa echingensis TaxID=3096516 RepID=A0ABW6CZG5_9BACT